jgi:putative phosphoribosyl transferase
LTSEKFADLASPGVRLADRLRSSVTNETILLGIASGGVPLAAVIAKQLELPIDVVLIKRLFAPNGSRFPVCASYVAGTLVMDDLPPPTSQLDSFINSALEELARREHDCRGAKTAADIRGKSVILVDNGVHTGSTLVCAIRAIRKLEPLRIISAVPVIAAESRAAVESETDNFICLTSAENFGHVGLWYSDFKKPSDEDLRQMLSIQTASFASNVSRRTHIMSEFQTQAEFEANLNSTFLVKTDSAQLIELKLIEVQRHQSEVHPRPDMERFSVFFVGPEDLFLPQSTYSLSHEKMGEFDLFLVPIAKESDGYRYEAIYNYYKSQSQQAIS